MPKSIASPKTSWYVHFPPTRRNATAALGAGITYVMLWIMAQSGEVADGGGHLWRVQDVREATVVLMLFTMFFTSLLAAMRLASDYARS